MKYKVGVVAGSGTPGLEKDFKNRGAVEVSFAYNSLYANKKLIESSIIDINKLVYIIQDEDMPLREDLSYLRDLLVDSKAYFKIKEINFLILKSSDYEQQLNYINVVMEDSKYSNYKIYTQEESFSYIDIYNYTLGTTELNRIKNKKVVTYMVERNSSVKRAYAPKLSDNSVKPYSYKELEEYEELKDISTTSDSGRPIEDRYIDDIEKFRVNPEFGYIADNKVIEKNVLVYTGRCNSGLTTFGLRCAMSALEFEHRVVYISLSSNNDIINYCREHKIKNKVYKLQDVLGKKTIEAKPNILNIVDLSDLDDSLKVSALSTIFTNKKFRTTLYFIECNDSLFNNVNSIIGYRINRVFFTVLPVKKEVLKIKPLVDFVVKEKLTVHGFKSNVLSLNSFCKIITRPEIKNYIGYEDVLIIEYSDDEFNPGPDLFEGIMGV